VYKSTKNTGVVLKIKWHIFVVHGVVVIYTYTQLMAYSFNGFYDDNLGEPASER